MSNLELRHGILADSDCLKEYINRQKVEEFEKIKTELKELDVEPDGIHFWRANRHETMNVVLHTIDNHIKELKGK